MTIEETIAVDLAGWLLRCNDFVKELDSFGLPVKVKITMDVGLGEPIVLASFTNAAATSPPPRPLRHTSIARGPRICYNCGKKIGKGHKFQGNPPIHHNCKDPESYR